MLLFVLLCVCFVFIFEFTFASSLDLPYIIHLHNYHVSLVDDYKKKYIYKKIIIIIIGEITTINMDYCGVT